MLPSLHACLHLPWEMWLSVGLQVVVRMSVCHSIQTWTDLHLCHFLCPRLWHLCKFLCWCYSQLSWFPTCFCDVMCLCHCRGLGRHVHHHLPASTILLAIKWFPICLDQVHLAIIFLHQGVIVQLEAILFASWVVALLEVGMETAAFEDSIATLTTSHHSGGGGAQAAHVCCIAWIIWPETMSHLHFTHRDGSIQRRISSSAGPNPNSENYIFSGLCDLIFCCSFFRFFHSPPPHIPFAVALTYSFQFYCLSLCLKAKLDIRTFICKY